MKIIRLACEQIPVPRAEEEIVGRGSNRITIAEEQLTSYFKVKVVGKHLQNSEIHIRLYSFPPSVPRAMLLSISNANSISTTVS
jgi:hypothetical protein